MSEEMLSMAEVASLVGVTRQRVHQRVKGISCSKPLPHTMVPKVTRKGGTRYIVRVAKADAEAWANEERRRKVKAPPPTPPSDVVPF